MILYVQKQNKTQKITQDPGVCVYFPFLNKSGTKDNCKIK